MPFAVHEVQWTGEKVANLWNAYSSNASLSYFAEEVGKEVIDLAQKHQAVGGEILDYGSGRGFLIETLLKKGLGRVGGCDFSPSSVELVNKRFKGAAGFSGCLAITSIPTKLAGEHYDTVFFLETVEHLLPDVFEPTLSELARLLKRGGRLVLTTRNEENLESSRAICPDCGCLFHPYQHVLSFSKDSLSDTMQRFGFAAEFCEPVNLEELAKGWAVRGMKAAYRAMAGKNRKPVNLVYIGKKV